MTKYLPLPVTSHPSDQFLQYADFSQCPDLQRYFPSPHPAAHQRIILAFTTSNENTVCKRSKYPIQCTLGLSFQLTQFRALTQAILCSMHYLQTTISTIFPKYMTTVIILTNLESPSCLTNPSLHTCSTPTSLTCQATYLSISCQHYWVNMPKKNRHLFLLAVNP